MSRRSRDKGARREREVLHLAQDAGFAATKHSGVYKSGHDVSWPLGGREWRIEVKARASGCRMLYRWLENRDAVLIKGDYERWLLVVPLLDAIPAIKAAEQAKV
jgi:Holliday junction resolvase